MRRCSESRPDLHAAASYAARTHFINSASISLSLDRRTAYWHKPPARPRAACMELGAKDQACIAMSQTNAGAWRSP
jgi:hypothetical protein